MDTDVSTQRCILIVPRTGEYIERITSSLQKLVFFENLPAAQRFLAHGKMLGLSGAARAREWGSRGRTRNPLGRVSDGSTLSHCAEYQALRVSARSSFSPPNTLGEDDVTSKNQPPLEGVTTLGKSAQGRD